jgi:hypothetical protein
MMSEFVVLLVEVGKGYSEPKLPEFEERDYMTPKNTEAGDFA